MLANCCVCGRFRRSSRLLCSFCGVQATEKVNEITSKENNVHSFKFETFMFYLSLGFM